MTEFRGARGSNTGDDFHELWATRHAIRLLSVEDGLQGVAVEGLAAGDEAASTEETWDGVDCTLYFGGTDARTAHHVVLEQLKYSGATPEAPWTVARLLAGKRRDRSVIARLAKAWKGLAELRPGHSVPGVVLISNQPVDSEVLSAFDRASTVPAAVPRTKPRATATVEAKLAYAAGLSADEFQKFSAALRFEGGAGSRFAMEEKVLRAITDWTDHDVRHVVTDLRQFVRQRMRPEFAGEVITRESVLLRLGASEGAALFPCPSEITLTEAPVSRAPVREAAERLLTSVRHLCLHGRGGVGKTTALQEIEAALPQGSIMITYDSYGGGRYLDPSALRHRPTDAFLQLTNELAARLKLPLLLSRHQGSDYPRLFANRLKHAAGALAAQHPGALVVIAIDAADNAVTAAQSRVPVESSFVHDFVLLADPPENVRFIITARTGRLDQLRLPSWYQTIEIEPFSRRETAENVGRVWSAPEHWIDDFHHLSGGVPRVQAYAFEVDGEHPSAALDRLRPDGKSLDEVFRQQFAAALTKSGNPAEVARLCAALIVLPRPVPLRDLAAVLNSTEALLSDVCADLAPGIRLYDGRVSFADEDFEYFVRREGASHLEEIHRAAASWLLSRAAHDQYAALNVAAALVAAGRGADLLELVEREPAPPAVTDPVLRREAEIQRLRLAIKVCREAGDAPRALRFVLIGAEGIKTEDAIRELLVNHPDMAAQFARATAGRLILSDPDHIEDHGPLLFQKLSIDAELGDAISVREGRRMLHAWMRARQDRSRGDGALHHQMWKISVADISSSVEAAFKLGGLEAALGELGGWRPRRIVIEVALSLPPRLIAEGKGGLIEEAARDESLDLAGKLFLLIPLSLAGHAVETDRIVEGLEALSRRRLRVGRYFERHHDSPSTHGLVLDAALTACEILTSRRAAPELVESLLDAFLAPELRRIDRRHSFEAAKLDLLFRAHALREARAGRPPNPAEVFSPRPEPAGEKERRNVRPDVGEHDRRLTEVADAFFSIYAATADALANSRTGAELANALQSALRRLEGQAWRLTRQHGPIELRVHAAKSLLVLLSAGHDPQMLKKFAADAHGRWRTGNSVPNAQLIARLSLRQGLHAPLVEDLAVAAAETRSMRIGADEKSRTLVEYARLLKPISPPDANAIFNDGVEAASELDREVMAQIRLLDTLITRGTGAFPEPRLTARRVADVVADAAIRLDGYDHFPWNKSMSALTRLDAPLALANAARWDDESTAKLGDTLPPLLKTGLRGKALNPAQSAALAVFFDGDHGVLKEALEESAASRSPFLPQLVEEAARDVLVRHGQSRNEWLAQFIQEHGCDGVWAGALAGQDQFLALHLSENDPRASQESEPTSAHDDGLGGIKWSRDAIVDSDTLRSAVKERLDQARAEERYIGAREILHSVRSAVSPRDRVDHLSALAGLKDPAVGDDAANALVEAIEAWWDSPAVRAWCRTSLPEVIVAWLPALSRYMEYDRDRLTPALERTGLPQEQLQELLLRGIENNVDEFGSDRIFSLAGLVGGRFTPADAAGLADWYAARLADRIPHEERDQTVPDAALPANIAEAVARFVFAYMGDYDLRMRWRAAHAVRRLARLGDVPTLSALADQYGRREEAAFRSSRLEFYWLAARLWFVAAWDRVAGERPEVAAHAGRLLLQIALDDSFPHLLVRSFARDACKKLSKAGILSLSPGERSALRRVNESPVPRSAASRRAGRGFPRDDRGRRFEFDSMDTLPYWYSPLLGSFADVDQERFLQEVERWIIDEWGYSGNIRNLDQERRRGRFEDRDWALTDNRHGSKPTLERLNTHLEWHAMWCAAGELLKTEALASNNRDRLSDRIKREKLVQPPLWSADLLGPTPLIRRNWEPDPRALREWADAVTEADHRAELFPEDQSEYMVVGGETERRTNDRTEEIQITSALVAPGTGGSLLRALQTMDDPWDYKLPDEGENFEIHEAPYTLLGWLRNPTRDSGLDEKDPLRGSASIITVRPGRRVIAACGLKRGQDWSARWFDNTSESPVFRYEIWGEEEKDHERYTSGLVVAGHRLLVHREKLQEFLRKQELDLIIEVQVTRRGRQSRRYAGEEENEAAKGRFDRLYRLGGEGALEVAEGCLGTWTGDRPRAPA